MEYRTFLNKNCDREVFGPLLSRHPNNLKVGTGNHEFLTGTLEEVTGSAEYEREVLADSGMSGEELHSYISFRIGEEDYMGAIEVSKDQAKLMQTYCNSITPVEAV